MPRSMPLAKLSVPRLHQAVPRGRLFSLLDAREHHPVIWVSGPAGCGKTTLVASYLEARRPRMLWYQVDEADTDPATLFHYLTMMIGQGGDRRPLPVAPADGDLVVFARHYFREFFGRLKRDAVLVFDNCQDATCEAFPRLLLAAADELPRHVSLILLSRSLPPVELARLAARRSMRVLDWDDLRLHASEARDIAGSLGITDTERIDDSIRLSDGWATGLVLALSHTKHHVDAPTARLNTREALFSYFLEEMLMRTSAAGRRVLMYTALLPQVSVDQAREISGSADAGVILEQLYRRQFLIDRKFDVQVIYQYHDLFRDFLREELTRALAPPDLMAVRLRAALLLEANGQVSEAVQLFLELRDWPNLIRCAKENAAKLLDQGRWQTVRSWIESTPQEMQQADPWLQQWLGRALFVPQPHAARSVMEAAYQRFIEARDYVGVVMAVRILVDATFVTGAPMFTFANWKTALAEAIANIPTFPSKQIGIDAWTTYVDLSNFGGDGGHLGVARSYLENCIADPQLTRADRLNALVTYCGLVWFSADAESCERALVMLLEELVHEESTPMFRVWGYEWAGLISWGFGRHALAAELIEDGLRWVETFRMGSQEFFPHHYLNLCYHHMDRSKEAFQVVSRARTRVLESRSLHGVFFAHTSAWDAYFREGPERAVAEIAQATALSESLGFFFATHFGYCMLAALHAQLGRWDEAERNLFRCETSTRHQPVEITCALRCFVRAVIGLDQGRHCEGMAYLRTGLEAARNELKAAMLYCLHRRLPSLLAEAVRECVAPEVVRRLIRRWDLKPSFAVLDRWPWPIKLYALGDLQVLVDEQPLPVKGKAHFRVLTLLKALIAAGGRSVSVSTLTEWLWPDSEGDAAVSNLKVAVHRLRRLLARDDSLTYHDGKVSLNPAVCWLDVWSFERVADCGVSGSPGELTAEQVLDLYRGPLLSGDETTWIIKPRQRLSALFRRASLDSGKQLETEGNLKRAACIYERCLSVEPDSEAVGRQLVRCLDHGGQEVRAMDEGLRCQRSLVDTSGRETLP